MEFVNLTPFDALAYSAMDKADRPYHVIAMSVGYQLHARQPNRNNTGYVAEVMDRQPLPLCLADEHWGDASHSSLKRESDLVPYKPRCDVLVIGHAYSREAQRFFESHLRVWQGEEICIDKWLRSYGPRFLYRNDGPRRWLGAGTLATRGYHLGESQDVEAVQQVPLRYELAYGGYCVIVNPEAGQAGADEYLINEVCYRNPVGTGWMANGYLEALAKTSRLPSKLPAPQIMRRGEYFKHFIVSEQSGAMNAQQMTQQDYKLEAAGFGPLCKAWAPRLALAGTYDANWQNHRHPGWPEDLNMAFFNGAPQDQQIPWPDLTKGLTIATENLKPGGGELYVKLPPHRAFALADLGGVRLPLPMQIDTLEIDSDKLQLRLVWRTALLQSIEAQSIELRFEVDPHAELVKYKALEA